jgi:hypothetical protein
MRKETFFKNEFIEFRQLKFNKSEIIEIIAEDNNEELTEEYWNIFIEQLNEYYNYIDRESRNYIMIVNIENTTMLSVARIKDVIRVLNNNKPLVKKYCVFTSVIVKSTFVRQILKIGLMFYTNEKPIMFESDYEKCRKKIIDNILGSYI